jgi:hypothetical protein
MYSTNWQMADRIGTLRPEDRAAVYEAAKRLQIDPYELGAVIHQESGFNPNVWGGAGGKYYGLIQFGTTERGEAGLNPKRIGSYTIREQLPHVEKWLAGRGYRPGMGVQKLYATILGGNPNANIYSKDANGTSVANAVGSFRPGGALYQRAKGTLGDAQEGTPLASYSPEEGQTTSSSQLPQGSFDSSRQQLNATVGQALLNSILRNFAGGDQSIIDYSPPTQPAVPHSNEADVEDLENSADYSELAELVKSTLKTNRAEDEARRRELMGAQIQSQQLAQKANMSNLMRQAMDSFKTIPTVF